MKVQNISMQTNMNSVNNKVSFGCCPHRMPRYAALDEAQRFLKSIKSDSFNSSKACASLRTLFDNSDSKNKMEFVNKVMEYVKGIQPVNRVESSLNGLASLKKNGSSDKTVLSFIED